MKIASTAYLASISLVLLAEAQENVVVIMDELEKHAKMDEANDQ